VLVPLLLVLLAHSNRVGGFLVLTTSTKKKRTPTTKPLGNSRRCDPSATIDDSSCRRANDDDAIAALRSGSRQRQLFSCSSSWQQRSCDDRIVGNTSCDITSATTDRAITPSSLSSGGSAIRRFLLASALAVAFATMTSMTTQPCRAAPPIAIIAEELGYFPVTNSKGETAYVAKRVQRESSDQAVELARKLRDRGVVMAGTYWCPHTGRQKELLGKRAFEIVPYVECSPRGYGADPAYCVSQGVDGYPTWIFPTEVESGGNAEKVGSGDVSSYLLSGERPLKELADQIGLKGFRENLEKDVPPLVGAGACKLR